MEKKSYNQNKERNYEKLPEMGCKVMAIQEIEYIARCEKDGVVFMALGSSYPFFKKHIYSCEKCLKLYQKCKNKLESE